MKKSAGILLYRKRNQATELLLVHPGGPFWKNKDAGAWSIPKGEIADNEDPLQAACRELEEETGCSCNGNFLALTPVSLRSGKTVYAWALEKDIDAEAIRSNLFQMEWPPKSGLYRQFPEVDKAQWFPARAARQKINAAQWPLVEELLHLLKER